MANLGITQKNITNFNGGELSPLLYGRTDLDIWSRGCRQLQNMLPRKYGNADRRVGTRFVAETKYPSKHSINVAFDLSSTVSLNIEMGDYYFRFDRLGTPVMNGSAPYEISHPYPESALDSVMFTQINDVMYVTHPDYPPYKLSHFADNNWTMVQVPFDEPVFKDMNITATTITPSGTTGTITLTASSALFNAAQVGGYYKLGQIRAANRVELPLTVTGTSAELDLKGNFTVRTSGTWAGTLEVQRYDTTTSAWSTIYTHISDKDRNVEASYKQDGVSARWRMVFTFISKDSTNPTAYLESAEDYVYGWAKITAFTSSTSVTATVEDPFLNTTATATWYEGAWSPYRGYPAACALFQQRMVYSGTYHQPQTIWGSVSNDYQNFEYGTDDDKAFQYTIGSQERLSTQWLCVHNNALIIGTSTGDWAMSGSNGGDDPVTPTNVIIRRQTTTGDAKIRPIVVDNAILHVQRNGEKLYEMTYSIQSYGYDDADITQFAEHITKSGIVSIAYARQPDGIIFCVRSDGVMLACVYDSSQKVIAWSRIVTQGFVESVAVIYGPVGDEVWLIVNRNVNGTWKRLKERLYPVLWDSKIDCWYLDCGYIAWNGEGGGGGGGGFGEFDGPTVPSNVVADKNDYVLTIGIPKLDISTVELKQIESSLLYYAVGIDQSDTGDKFPMYFSAEGVHWQRATLSGMTIPSGAYLRLCTIFNKTLGNYSYFSVGVYTQASASTYGQIMVFGSVDGLAWTKLSISIDGLSYLGTLFVTNCFYDDASSNVIATFLVSYSSGSGYVIFKSPDCINWTQVVLNGNISSFDSWINNSIMQISENGYSFSCVPAVSGYNGKFLRVHSDLYNFDEITTGTSAYTPRVNLGGGKFLGANRAVSTDYGSTWSTVNNAPGSFPAYPVSDSSGKIICINEAGSLNPAVYNSSHIFLFPDLTFTNPVYGWLSQQTGKEAVMEGPGRTVYIPNRRVCKMLSGGKFMVILPRYNIGGIYIGGVAQSYDNVFIYNETNLSNWFNNNTEFSGPCILQASNSPVPGTFMDGDYVEIRDTGTSLDGKTFTAYKIADYPCYLIGINIPDPYTYPSRISTGEWIHKIHKVSGLSALAGSTVDALCDGSVEKDLTVDSGGGLTLNGYYDQVVIGLPYETILEPMGTDAATESGSATGQTRRYRKAIVNLKDTLGMSFTTEYATYNKIVSVGTTNDAGDIIYTDAVFRNSSDVISESPELFTGLFEINLDAHHSRDPRLVLKQSAPMPFNCLGLTFKYEITEPSSGKAQQ